MRRLRSRLILAPAAVPLGLPPGVQARAACTLPAGDLLLRQSLVRAPKGGLLESGAGDPPCPAGSFLSCRTLCLAIGVGDVGTVGSYASGNPRPGEVLPSPRGPSSTAAEHAAEDRSRPVGQAAQRGLHAYARVARNAWQGQTLHWSSGGADRIALEEVVDPAARTFAPLLGFARIPNGWFGVGSGGAGMDELPTGITSDGQQRLVTQLRVAPFATGTSTVEQFEPVSGVDTPGIAGLATASYGFERRGGANAGAVALEHAATGLFSGRPGEALHFVAPEATPGVLPDRIVRPPSMVLDHRVGARFVASPTARSSCRRSPLADGNARIDSSTTTVG